VEPTRIVRDVRTSLSVTRFGIQRHAWREPVEVARRDQEDARAGVDRFVPALLPWELARIMLAVCLDLDVLGVR
jgi:hypothetical protein